MANIENKENTNKPINKTTETLIKELETMSDSGLHDMFIFFYKLNCQHGNRSTAKNSMSFLKLLIATHSSTTRTRHLGKN